MIALHFWYMFAFSTNVISMNFQLNKLVICIGIVIYVIREQEMNNITSIWKLPTKQRYVLILCLAHNTILIRFIWRLDVCSVFRYHCHLLIHCAVLMPPPSLFQRPFSEWSISFSGFESTS